MALMIYYIQAPGIAGGSDEKAREQATEIGKIDALRGTAGNGGGRDRYGEPGECGAGVPPGDRDAPRRVAGVPPARLFLHAREQWDSAIAQFRKYVEVAPKDADSHDSLGEALLAKGSTDEALASYLKALSVDASFGASMHGAATCYDRKGMKSEAAKRYRQYADTYPTARDAKAARERADELEGK